MALGLDLSSSQAKIDRASEHLCALDRESMAAFTKALPYLPGPIKIDEESGWADIVIVPQQVPESARLSAIAGDVHHNLRSALDYIVAALVAASPATLTTRHQFPIFEDPDEYRKKVADGNRPVGRSYLGNVKHGLAEIENLQPYYCQPNPIDDPLAHLQRFSNYDKHRSIAVFVPLHGNGKVRIDHDGVVLERRDPPTRPAWKPGDQLVPFVVQQVRFARPYPTNAHAYIETPIGATFSVPPRKQETTWVIHDLPFLVGIRDHVRTITERFETL